MSQGDAARAKQTGYLYTYVLVADGGAVPQVGAEDHQQDQQPYAYDGLADDNDWPVIPYEPNDDPVFAEEMDPASSKPAHSF